jgi:hypothetical protein
MARSFSPEDRKAGLTLVVRPFDDPEQPVDAERFLAAATKWLTSLSSFAADSGLAVRWEIAELRRSSAVLEVVPVDTRTGTIASSVAKDWETVMKEVERTGAPSSAILPTTIKDMEQFASTANNLTVLVSAGDEGFSTPITITTQKRLKEAAAALPAEEYAQEGTLRGYLAVLNSWNSEDRWFRLRVPLAPDKQIKCVYADETLIESLGQTFEKLVNVSGTMHYKKGDLWPHRIDIRSVKNQQPLSLDQFLANMSPVVIPHGMDSVSAIRSLRDAE